MANRSVVRRVAQWALLLASAWATVVIPAIAIESVAIQAPAELPPALMLTKH